MAGIVSNLGRTQNTKVQGATTEARWVRYSLIATALIFLSLFLLLPLVVVFTEAFAKGAGVYFAAITEPAAAHAIKLTLIAAAIAVPLNVVFGLAASWAIAKFQFRGKQLAITLIDVPFAVSPVIAGLIYMLLFGAQGLFGHWLMDHEVRIMFAVPGIVFGNGVHYLPLYCTRINSVNARTR